MQIEEIWLTKKGRKKEELGEVERRMERRDYSNADCVGSQMVRNVVGKPR